MINKILKTNTVIIGTDINVSISIRDSKKEEENEETNILEPCRNPKKNERGEMILNLLRQTDMRATATYFDNANGHEMWTHPAMKEKFQLDHFMVSRAHCKYIADIKKKYIGAPSDPLTSLLKIQKQIKEKETL